VTHGDVCAGAGVTVPAGAQRTLVVDVMDFAGTVDHDQITFACTP
jgi:hypothetical protein